MKKINPRIISLIMILLSALAVGGISIREAFAPGAGGFGPEPDSDGG